MAIPDFFPKFLFINDFFGQVLCFIASPHLNVQLFNTEK